MKGSIQIIEENTDLYNGHYLAGYDIKTSQGQAGAVLQINGEIVGVHIGVKMLTNPESGDDEEFHVSGLISAPVM